MNKLLVLTVLIPILSGIIIPHIPFKNKKHMHIVLEIAILLNTALVYFLLFHKPEAPITVVYFTGNLSVTFHMDGLAMVFTTIIATLWPLATLYAFEYMEHDKHEKVFFMFYTITYGVTLGIALSANVITMYFFYELLTLVTVPLVMHTLTRQAILASRKYLYYSLGGAAFAFIGVIFILIYGENGNFVYGGVMSKAISSGGLSNVLLIVYLFAFLGFGVKAAICPFNGWLPDAGVAPTPVTALLHAVAVVKSGAFAIMRITYYSFGADNLRGTWVQYVVMAVVIFTIIYGCSMALKETHFKRRLAYSTISNLSYILFGVVIMTPLGLIGALCHLVFHAVMKISSFFCAGAVIHKTDRTFIYELDGLGRKMPITFGVFALSSFALMGVPGLCGFISKWYLANAAVESGNVLAYAGVGALLISALLTAIYMVTIVVRAFFPAKDFDYSTIENVKDPSIKMTLPLILFSMAMLFMGMHSTPIIEFFKTIAYGAL